MPNEQKDSVQEARELLDAVDKSARVGYAFRLLKTLADEVERLRRGEFTAEEFQSLCHDTNVQAGFEAFADGCELYQQKLFGRCRKGSTTR